MIDIEFNLNGRRVTGDIDDRQSLADYVRENESMTGTHLGCEHGVCGACTVLVDGQPVRGCITLAASVHGHDVRTIEGFEDDHLMTVIRQAFRDAHGLQCGFRTPGMLIMVRDMIQRGICTDASAVRQELSGNICRCTGYQGIVNAVLLAGERWEGNGEGHGRLSA